MTRIGPVASVAIVICCALYLLLLIAAAMGLHVPLVPDLQGMLS